MTELKIKRNSPPQVYVAGPLGGIGPCDAQDQHTRVLAALRTAELLRKAGALPFVPHLFWYWATLTPTTLDRRDWVEMDMEHLGRSDALLRIWGPSDGADAEVTYMESLGRPTFLADSDKGDLPVELEGWIHAWLINPEPSTSRLCNHGGILHTHGDGRVCSDPK